MESKNIQIRALTNAEMSMVKGAGTDPGYIGPAIEPGTSDRDKERNFFSSLMAFFTFDIGGFFDDAD